jgi:thiol-disulfide isomerase/thioredoxin
MLLAAAALLASTVVPMMRTPPASAAQPPTISGLWDATIDVGSMQVPFRFGIAAGRGKVAGWFFNGDERVISTAGSLDGKHLSLDFATYARRLDVTENDDGSLTGVYAPTTPGSKAQPYAFHARHAATAAASSSAAVPSIAGLWLIPTEGRKAGEKAWRLVVRQSAADVSAAILRVDGDTGALTGRWRDGGLLLSHFDGARPSLIEVTAAADGSLQLLVRDAHGADVSLHAYRPEQAQAKGLPDAADPARHTSINDADEPFHFRFPNLDGQLISSTDNRFRGKVLVIDVAGSWCPNCHDEAPFLEALYRKYHRRGLEVVTLAFEESEQLVNPFRLRAFIKDYDIDYTVLLAGTPEQLHDKLPQAVGLDAFPTTFFVGRDARVHGVHAGFAAPATGAFNTRLKREFTLQIEQLLDVKAPPPLAAASGPGT